MARGLHIGKLLKPLRRLLRRILPGGKPDLPFHRDDANHFLPWIIAFLIFLTSLILAGGITINSAIMNSSATYGDRFTVQIPYQADNMARIVERSIAVLKRTPGVANAAIVEDKEVKRLVEPWLGSSDILQAIPLPVMIEATLTQDSKNTINYTALTQELHQIQPQIEVDDNKVWMAQFSQFTRMIQWLAFGVAALMVLTTAAIIVLSARTAVKLHHGTVVLLHSMGAYDDYVTRQFQRNAFLVTLKGALGGAVIALVFYWLIGISASQFNAPLLPSFKLSALHVLMFIGLPLIMAGTALMSTRMSVLSLLRRMP